MKETIHGIISILVIIMPYLVTFIAFFLYAKLNKHVKKGEYITCEEIESKFNFITILSFVAIVAEAFFIAVLINWS